MILNSLRIERELMYTNVSFPKRKLFCKLYIREPPLVKMNKKNNSTYIADASSFYSWLFPFPRIFINLLTKVRYFARFWGKDETRLLPSGVNYVVQKVSLAHP